MCSSRSQGRSLLKEKEKEFCVYQRIANEAMSTLKKMTTQTYFELLIMRRKRIHFGFFTCIILYHEYHWLLFAGRSFVLRCRGWGQDILKEREELEERRRSWVYWMKRRNRKICILSLCYWAFLYIHIIALFIQLFNLGMNAHFSNSCGNNNNFNIY